MASYLRYFGRYRLGDCGSDLVPVLGLPGLVFVLTPVLPLPGLLDGDDVVLC